MTSPPDPIQPLREALAASPDNVPLRRHLADTLRAHGRFDEAVAEYKELLGTAPSDDVRLCLAATYLDAGKASHAAVLVELVTGRADAPAAAWALLARVRLAERDPAGAASAFGRAVDLDPALASSPLATDLGFHAVRTEDSGDTDAASPEEIEWDDDDEHRRARARAGGPDEPHEGDGRVTDADFERPLISFADVGGMDDVKEEISIKVVQPLAHPELFAAYGKTAGGGVLMYGPPGCGKTHIARATAGEARAAFISVGIHEVLDMYIGASEQNLHRLFDEARRRAPCVLFFDEVDALGAKRADAASSSSRQIINQFLAELDGVDASNDGMLVLAATNAPWHLDAAFRRPGRFDRLVFVPPPDASARAAILEVLLADKPIDGIELAKLAKRTKDFSGADLAGLVETAVESKLREAMKTGRPSPLTTKDLVAAAKRVRPTTAEWFGTAKNHVQFANQSGQYDDVARYLGMRGSRGGDA
ncbi:MAG: AAA family ATPase [Planctomycetota bacterium]